MNLWYKSNRLGRGCWLGGAARALVAFVLAALTAGAARGAPALRVCLIGGNDQPAAQTQATLSLLVDYLTRSGLGECSLTVLQEPDGKLVGALQASDVAVLWVHGRSLTQAGKAAVLNFVSEGKGLVVLGAAPGAWTDWPEFEAAIMGAHFGGKFAGGSSMRIINLLPHAIFTGIHHFDTLQAMRECELASDAQVIMEGVVGENPVPMGWVRRYGKSRIVSLEPDGRAVLGDPDYRAIILNSVRWAGGRPIPGARALIQRTYMSGAYPGALAITFPEGPSLCFDTVRGGINYVWDGDFIDLHPWWTSRHGEPLRNFAARFAGRVLYQETTLAPAMHVGPRDAESAYHFRGYRLKSDGYPELRYSVGGREVTEDLYTVVDGPGVTCTFRVAAGEAPLWLRLDPGAGGDVSIAGAAADGNFVRFDSAEGGEFTVTIRNKIGRTR